MRIAGGKGSRAASAVLAGALLCFLCGCGHHKGAKPQAVVLPPQLPVPLETLPVQANPPLVESPGQTKLPAVPVAEAATKPKRPRRKSKAAAAQAPGQTAGAPAGVVAGQTAAGTPPATGTPVQAASNAADPGPETVIGALTPGVTDATPHMRQDAKELLASTDRRLNALPAQTQQSQRVQISQVRNFWKQGLEALRAGDAEGALTLATKAKLLLDDLDKLSQ